MSNQPPFEFGQTVYLVEASPNHQVGRPCPVCFGKLSVTIILGNGEQQPIECEMCEAGYLGPRGIVSVGEVSSSVIQATITGLEMEGDDWRISSNIRSYRQNERRFFAEKESAEQRRIELHSEAEDQAQKNFESRFRQGKKHSWSVGYHRNQIRDLERQLGWHREKLTHKKAVK